MSTTTTTTTTPIPLPISSSSPNKNQNPQNIKIFFQLQIPGVPWYIYHDRFDAYLPHEQGPDNLSVAVLDLSLSLSLTHPQKQQHNLLLLSGAKIPLPSSFPIKGGKPQPQTEQKWKPIPGKLKGWHRSPGPIKDFVFVAERMHPSSNYRSVLCEGEYLVTAVMEGGGEDSDDERVKVAVRLKSLVGEGKVDGNTADRGWDEVPSGKGEFWFVLRRGVVGGGEDGGDEDGGDGKVVGWEIVETEGVEMQEGETFVDW